MNEMIKTIKQIHKEELCMFKIGSFCHCYGRDAYVLSFLFGYKIKDIEGIYKECGFPIKVLDKVIAKLENCKINYLVIDRRNDYDVEQKASFKNLNNYNSCYVKANTYINYKIRIEKINEFLLENMKQKEFNKILGKVEQVINERREI